MAALLQSLQDLQQVEMKLHALRDKIEAKQRQVRSHERKLKRAESEIQTVKDQILRKQAEAAQHELEIKTHDEEISKLRGGAQPLQDQQGVRRDPRSDQHGQRLTPASSKIASSRSWVRSKPSRREQADLTEKLELETKKLESAKREAESFAQASDDELGTLERNREQAASDVPPEALALFERASERHDGEVLAAVLQPHPKRQEFICDGCNMTVTLEQYVSLRGRDAIQVCQNCSRVLVLEEALAR